MSKFKILTMVFSFLFIGTVSSFSGGGLSFNNTDTEMNFTVIGVYDLRDRESFIQVTNVSSGPATLHVQIFNAGNLCIENDFFDVFTGNDTHVYNMRDILTNDGNDSGVVLPADAYGVIVISTVDIIEGGVVEGNLIGNFRIADNSGYEYRTNMIGKTGNEPDFDNLTNQGIYLANFNQQGGASLSDVFGASLSVIEGSVVEEWDLSNIINNFLVYDVDIINNNEVLLSCRDVIFACVKPTDDIVDELFAETEDIARFEGQNGALVASFEYGINEAIPHSKGGELLCPGNTIDEGIVKLTLQGIAFPEVESATFLAIIGYIGLNNGNGRGSMDSLWETSLEFNPFFNDGAG